VTVSINVILLPIMRTPGNDAERAAHAIDPHPPREPRAMCPPTPPPEICEEIVCDTGLIRQKDDGATEGNSAAALSMIQDRSLYATPEGDDDERGTLQVSKTPASCDNEGEVAIEDGFGIDTGFSADVELPSQSIVDAAGMPTPESVAMDTDTGELFRTARLSQRLVTGSGLDSDKEDQPIERQPNVSIEMPNERGSNDHLEAFRSSNSLCTTTNHATMTTAPSDLPPTPRFDFSNKRLYPHYPSSFLRPGSKFSGTQQSDRQIYNVDVQVLTLSVPESTMTGYLRICGLTEDHPTLTTFFTGEIIGGPTHKHTFRTKDPSWGATDRTDLQHWARFPSWRPLSKEAKRDIDFKYPAPATGPGSRPPPPPNTFASASDAAADEVEFEYNDDANPGWWTQPNVFMRWKEWFLVPDHRVRSIQGALRASTTFASIRRGGKSMESISMPRVRSEF
jgi:Vacuolar import and degradation protein